MLVLLLCQGIAHRGNLRQKPFNFRLFLLHQTVVYNHPALGNTGFLKTALCVALTVAIVKPLNKLEKPCQRQQGVSVMYRLFRMYRQIPQLDYVRQLAPGAMIQGKAESRFVNQRLQIILIRHSDGVIGGIHPFHG